jgi:hypothetical protein
MKKRRLVIIAAMAAALGVFAYLKRSRGDIGKTVTLADGSTITLVNSDYGTNIFCGSAMERLLRRSLPLPIRERLNLVFGGYASDEPNLWVYFRMGGKITNDSLALRFHDNERYGQGASLFSIPGQSLCQGFTVFPRRSSLISLRVYRLDGKSRGFETFLIPNPITGPFPDWKPDSLPASRRSGDLAITLIRAVADSDERSNEGDTHTQFQVLQNGKPTTDWQPKTVKVSDATGNQANRLWRERSNLEEGIWSFDFGSPYLPGEPAWKMQVEFSKVRTATFLPEELWEIKGLAIPNSNAVNQVNLTTNLQGITVHCDSLTGFKLD